MSTVSERIQNLAMHNNAQNYLEIGVCKGDTFFNVNLQNKVAVDPDFQLNILEREESGSYFYALTPNDFFDRIEQLENLQSLKKDSGKVTFDIIYLDGLHTYEQTLLDFENSLNYSHPKTIWVIDDTVPCDPYSAIPDQAINIRYRRQAGLADSPWHGDVFKIIFHLYEKYKKFSYCTVIDKGNPQTVVWQTEVPRKEEGFNFTKSPEELQYFDIFDYADIFVPVSDAALPKLLGRTINPRDYHQKDSWTKLFYRKLVTLHERSLLASQKNL